MTARVCCDLCVCADSTVDTSACVSVTVCAGGAVARAVWRWRRGPVSTCAGYIHHGRMSEFLAREKSNQDCILDSFLSFIFFALAKNNIRSLINPTNVKIYRISNIDTVLYTPRHRFR